MPLFYCIEMDMYRYIGGPGTESGHGMGAYVEQEDE